MSLKTAGPLLLLVAAIAHGRAEDAAIKEPALREELLAMEQESADLRTGMVKQLGQKGVPLGVNLRTTDPALMKAAMEPSRQLNELGKKQRTRLKEIVAKHGWPGRSLVGPDGAHAAWWLVQHDDRDRAFQQRCLKLMKAAVKGEVERSDIAYLTDSILIGEKKKQRYGTQLQLVKGVFKVRPIEDAADVDKRRADMGLATLDEYLASAQEAYDRSVGKKK